MRKKYFFIGTILMSLVLIIGIFTFGMSEKKVESNGPPIKVGFYNQYPYYYINSENRVTGYYNDLLREISERTGIKYEYIYCDKNNLLSKLDNGEIDLAFGISKTEKRADEFLFSNQYVNNENCSIFTNKDIKHGDLKKLSGLKMAYINGDYNNKYILDMLKEKGIDVDVINVNSNNEADKLLVQNKVDFIVENRECRINHNKDIKSIFEFSTGPVYIVTRKDNTALMDKIDESNSIGSSEKKYDKVYTKYFNKKSTYVELVAIIALIILGVIIFKKQKKKIKFRKKQESIRSDLEKGRFLLYYQPIVDPKTNQVKGFEGLIRLKKNGKILTPYHFLKDIEAYDMSLEVALWCFEKVVSDYEIIKEYDFVKNNKFYISFNISFEEIKDSKFLKALSERVNSYGGNYDTICLEIVEKFSMKEADKIQEAIKQIKDYGFLIAIDDFGVEYSNLDLLNKIDSNIIKLDKYFIDNINNDINLKIVEFISEICKLSNRTIVFEGVEQEEQVNIIREFSYEKIYIQGYYYSKPLAIEDLKNFQIKSQLKI